LFSVGVEFVKVAEKPFCKLLSDEHLVLFLHAPSLPIFRVMILQSLQKLRPVSFQLIFTLKLVPVVLFFSFFFMQKDVSLESLLYT
jgi:hypothetical protein